MAKRWGRDGEGRDRGEMREEMRGEMGEAMTEEVFERTCFEGSYAYKLVKMKQKGS